ncbi:heterokaryon incompatibility protein-domain-containing protein [Hyaloscypha finlandica]|nr:heterokaryon incompatibility protein-domain-containing protein [Hyaloscypha finlandica]
MRLLNVKTGKLEEYFGSSIPKYAILSHTWGKDEVTFSDIQNIRDEAQAKNTLPHEDLAPFPANVHDPSVERKSGYQKIVYACRQALMDGHQYVWIDTCCIDKSSSTELSEAINSMFQWYQKAGICYAYLEDVPVKSFATSRWFTRGWTLQELLAPPDVIFYGEKWTLLGEKLILASLIAEVTKIGKETILDRSRLKYNSIAQRMSWASKRKTTRMEDVAYCLLGICGVNMPLLYGEGENAFIRLQEEILKSSVDQSLFAWGLTPGLPDPHEGFGILAPSPGNFQDSSSMISFQRTTATAPYIMTNQGLQIELPIIEKSGDVLGLLDCQFHDEASTCIAIRLKRTHKSDVFVRVGWTAILSRADSGLVRVTHEQATKATTRRIYIPRSSYEYPLERSNYEVKFPTLEEQGFVVVATRPSRKQVDVEWNEQAKTLQIVHGKWNSIYKQWHVAFVFHNARTKMAFAVYFDEVPTINERLPTEEMSIEEIWLSPLVHEPTQIPHLYALGNWWHSLSHGQDYFGVAYQRHPALWFRRTNDTHTTSHFAISARLESTNRFGQKFGVLHVSLSTTAHPASVSEGKYSSIDVWEPSHLPYLWTKWREFSVRDVRPASQSSSLPGFPTNTEGSYSRLEVAPPSPST